MIVFEGLRMALRSLWTHKGRSALTILGVVIGVASVLAVTSLGAAFEEDLLSNFDDLDQRSIFVAATVSDVTQGPPDAGQFGLIFTEVDQEGLAELDGVEKVIAASPISITAMKFGDESISFRSITATSSDAEEIEDEDAYADGGPFEEGEFEIVLGSAIAARLDDPEEGDTITITYPDGDTEDLEVAGILEEQDGLLADNWAVYVPIDPLYTVETESPSSGDDVLVFEGFTVIVDDILEIDLVKAEVKEYMEDESDAEQLREDDVEIIIATPSDIQSGISDAFASATIFIAAIAGVSLLVGGIMIGTIMLITVTERTKEIGMMKAIGAYDGEILRMFLLEAVVIGFLGSIIGIIFGLGLGAALVPALFGGEGTDTETVKFVVPWEWVGWSMIVGVATGAIAGFFPARRATKIEPVESLGYE